MKKIITGLLLIVLFMQGTTAHGTSIAAGARSYWLYETGTGQILAENHSQDKTAAASLTKLMTCLLALEAIQRGELEWSEAVTVPSDYINPRGSTMDLQAGEAVTVRQLVNGLMIVSANDGAQVLARRISGSEAAFVMQMNRRAKELGLERTAFLNATGLPEAAGQNMTSAADMGRLSAHLLKEHGETLLGITGQRLLQDPQRKYSKPSTNTLMYLKVGVDGLKTGHTNSAGYCLSATMPFRQDRDSRLIAVVMGTANEKARDNAARELLDWADKNYDFVTLIDKQASYSAGNWRQLTSRPVTGHPESTVERLMNPIDRQPVRVTVTLPSQLPLGKGDVIGSVTTRLPGGEEVTVPLISDTEIIGLTLLEQLQLFIRSIGAWLSSVGVS